MRKMSLFMLLIVALTCSAWAPGLQTAPTTHLKVGDPAPEFTLRDQNGESVSLGSFKGKRNIVLAFYVLAFTGG